MIDIINFKVGEITDDAIEESVAACPPAFQGKFKSGIVATLSKAISAAVTPVWAALEAGLAAAQEKIQKPLEAALDKVFEVEAQLKLKFKDIVGKVLGPVLAAIKKPLENILQKMLEPVGKFYQAFLVKLHELEKMFLEHIHDFDKLFAKISEIEKGFFGMIATISKELKNMVGTVKTILKSSAEALAGLADIGEIGDIFESLSGVIEDILKVLDVNLFGPLKKIITTIKNAASGGLDEAVKAVTECIDAAENDVIGELSIKASPAKDAIASALASAPDQIKKALVGLVDSFIDIPENTTELFKHTFEKGVKDAKDGDTIKKLHAGFLHAGAVAYKGMKDGLVKAISTAFHKLTQGLIVPNVLKLVIPPVKDAIEPLSEQIPEAVKTFIDPVEVLIDFIVEQIEMVVDTILEPFQKLIEEVLGKVASAFGGKKEEKKHDDKKQEEKHEAK